MGLEELNKSLENHWLYIFCQRHKKVINIIEGIFIILLLVSINTYLVKDHFIKKQIRDNCGYTDNNVKCVCEKNYVDNWEDLNDQEIELNLTNGIDNDSMDIGHS